MQVNQVAFLIHEELLMDSSLHIIYNNVIFYNIILISSLLLIHSHKYMLCKTFVIKVYILIVSMPKAKIKQYHGIMQINPKV